MCSTGHEEVLGSLKSGIHVSLDSAVIKVHLSLDLLLRNNITSTTMIILTPHRKLKLVLSVAVQQ